MLNISRCLRLLCLCLLALPLAACDSGPKMGRFTYRVTLDDAFRDTNTGMMPSIEVDLVGVNDAEKDRWDAQNLDEYFTPRNVIRANANRHTMAYTNSNPGAKTLAADASVWNIWTASGATNMFIFASIPMDSDASGVDHRRLVLPLDRNRWPRGVTIEILIRPSGVECRTAQKPLKR